MAMCNHLLLACRQGHIEEVEELIAGGAGSADGWELASLTSPLSWSCVLGHRNVAEVLLRRGGATASGEALHWALSYNRKEMALLMVSRGADPAGEAKSGQRPFLQLAEMVEVGLGAALVEERRKYLTWMRRRAFLAVLSESGCLAISRQPLSLPVGTAADSTIVEHALRVAHRSIASYI